MLINLTPHAIVIVSPEQDGALATIEPSGKVARVQEFTEQDGEINGILCFEKWYGKVEVLSRESFLAKEFCPPTESMPREEEGIIYIVPMLVGQQLKGKRSDIVGPDFGIGGYRNKSGNLKGALGFIRY